MPARTQRTGECQVSGLANGALILNELRLWRSRQDWTAQQGGALDAAEDALEDIIAGRMSSTQLTVQEAIAMKERGEL